RRRRHHAVARWANVQDGHRHRVAVIDREAKVELGAVRNAAEIVGGSILEQAVGPAALRQRHGRPQRQNQQCYAYLPHWDMPPGDFSIPVPSLIGRHSSVAVNTGEDGIPIDAGLFLGKLTADSPVAETGEAVMTAPTADLFKAALIEELDELHKGVREVA